MNLIEVTKRFADKEACLDYLEKMRWPNGICCLKCGITGKDEKGRECISKFTTNETTRKRFSKKKNKTVEVTVPSRSLYQCKECGYQFAATTGTVFHDSHTYLTPKKPRKGRPYVKKDKRDVVLGMIERGGKLRLVPIADGKMEAIEPVIEKHVSTDATLQTDESAVYAIIGKRRFPGRHRTINHAQSYGIGDLHTNTIENAFSLLKRGVYGTFHKVSIKHLGRYCNEFSYRFNRRHSQRQMFDETMKGLLNGQPLPFKTLTASAETTASDSASENS